MTCWSLRSLTLLVMSLVLLGGTLNLGSARAGAQGTAAANPFADLNLPEIAITLTEETITGAPGELAAGRYVLAVTNTIPAPDPTIGPPTSGAVFAKVPADLTVDAFLAQLGPPPGDDAGPGASPAAGGPPAPPPWFYETTLTGGPYVLPDQTGYAVIDLAPGDWVILGQSDAASPAPVTVSVTGEAPADLAVPEAAVRANMAEYAFSVSPSLSSGPHIIEVVNSGEQPHFLTITQVPAGTTVDDVMTLFGMGPDPMATPAGGLGFDALVPALGSTVQSSGVTAWYAADLAAGTYLVACFFPDPGGGAPHAMLGMAEIIVVE